MIKQLCILTLLMVVACQQVQAQPKPNRLINEGNKLYEQKKYKEAAVDYQRALQKNPTYVPGIFNLGNTLFQQGQFDASRQVLSNVSKVAKTKEEKSGAHYNIGNSYMQEKKWEEAIAAYKNALRNNPQDMDAKYNLSYAEQMLKKQQDGGGKNNKQDKNKDNKQDKQDQQNKDNKKQDQNKDQQKDQDNKDQQDKKDQQDQQPQGQPSKLSKEQADQLLNALQQEEKKLQDKKQKQKGVPVRMEKDW